MIKAVISLFTFMLFILKCFNVWYFALVTFYKFMIGRLEKPMKRK